MWLDRHFDKNKAYKKGRRTRFDRCIRWGGGVAHAPQIGAGPVGDGRLPVAAARVAGPGGRARPRAPPSRRRGGAGVVDRPGVRASLLERLRIPAPAGAGVVDPPGVVARAAFRRGRLAPP